VDKARLSFVPQRFMAIMLIDEHCVAVFRRGDSRWRALRLSEKPYDAYADRRRKVRHHLLHQQLFLPRAVSALTRSSSSTRMPHMASCFSNQSCSSNTRALSARLTPTVGRSGVSFDAKSPMHSSATDKYRQCMVRRRTAREKVRSDRQVCGNVFGL
jgi:hypothetical protein